MKSIASILGALVLTVVVAFPAVSADDRLIIASTTSTENSGLFKELIPAYYEWTEMKGVRVDVVAVGTGKAIEIARRGDADMLFVHDKAREEQFVADGWGVKRVEVMYNDFVVVGPSTDPAKASDAPNAVTAFQAIASSKASFVSRGDESGTHSREKLLWQAAGVDVATLASYLSAGQGMAETLRLADDKGAYTLSDRATYNTSKNSLKNIAVVFQGDPMLFNQYSVIAVNPAKHPHVNSAAAADFIKFVTGPDGQSLIGGFRDAQGGTLFVPNAN